VIPSLRTRRESGRGELKLRLRGRVSLSPVCIFFTVSEVARTALTRSSTGKKYESSSDGSSSSASSSSSESDSEAEKKKRRKAKTKAKLAKQKNKKSKVVLRDSSASSTDNEADSVAAAEAASTAAADDAAAKLATQKAAIAAAMQAQAAQSKTQLDLATLSKALTDATATATAATATQSKKNIIEFKRVDQVWDSKIRDYKYTESVEDVKDEFDCVFTVRRRFGWDNKYIETMIDIKSKVLRSVLQVIFKDCKSVSLVEDKPSIHPHLLFHYYSEIKTYVKKTLKKQHSKAKKRKSKKTIAQQIKQGQLLLNFVDEDYEETRKALKPMLKAGELLGPRCHVS
jgi:hypothetical protein